MSEAGFVPGSDAEPDEIFQYPFTVEEETINYLCEHGRIMFIIRGLAGTGKESLAAMLHERYPSSITFCADNFFKDTFSKNKRTSQTLAQAHDWCKNKVEAACIKGVHPVIVKNTHVKIFEMKNYLSIAAQHGYIIIIASTMHKFIVTPEILAKSNTKGLTVDYFRGRLKQWQDMYPTLVGWFISPCDSNYILHELQTSLDQLMGDGKFCRIMDAFETEKLLNLYDAKKLLYCVAACNKNNVFDLKSYCNSKKVKDNYGRCFTITIQGFLVTSTNIFAISHLDDVMEELHQNVVSFSKNDAVDDLEFDSLNISKPCYPSKNFIDYHKICSLSEKFSIKNAKSICQNELKEDEGINIKRCSCIHIAQGKGKERYSLYTTKVTFHKLLSTVADAECVIHDDQFGELDNGYKYCRLPNNAWIIKQPYKLSLKSVFTGMYV